MNKVFGLDDRKRSKNISMKKMLLNGNDEKEGNVKMTNKVFKEKLSDLLDESVDGYGLSEKIDLVKDLLVTYQQKHENQMDTSNKGKTWTDEELEIILSAAPTRENCAKFARIFKRGYGSIEQIYRWAATTDRDVKMKRSDDTFIQQIKRIAKKIGFRA